MKLSVADVVKIALIAIIAVYALKLLAQRIPALRPLAAGP